MAAVIEYKLTGGAGNSDPDASLGGTTSSESLANAAINNLFDNVTPDDTEFDTDVNYRAFAIKNTGDATAKHVDFFLTDTVNSESILATWYDSTGTQSIINEDVEPVGAVWTQPLTGSKLSFPDMAPGDEYRMWIRRTVDQNAANLNDDTATLHTWSS